MTRVEIPVPDEIRLLPTRRLGCRLWHYACLASTNALALALGDDPTHDGLALLADEQTAGRGQYGRTWQAPPGSSVLLTVLLFPPAPLRRPALLTTWAAVAVAEAIFELTARPVRIKWPNDLFIEGKKVCGILIEQRGTTGRPPATAVGIGLNVTQSAELFRHAGLTLAGSLASQTGTHVSTRAAADALLRHLDAEYERLCKGDFAALEMRWKNGLGLLGRQVQVEGMQRDHAGRLLDVTLEGVELEVAPGNVLRLAPESVRHLVEAS